MRRKRRKLGGVPFYHPYFHGFVQKYLPSLEYLSTDELLNIPSEIIGKIKNKLIERQNERLSDINQQVPLPFLGLDTIFNKAVSKTTPFVEGIKDSGKRFIERQSKRLEEINDWVRFPFFGLDSFLKNNVPKLLNWIGYNTEAGFSILSFIEKLVTIPQLLSFVIFNYYLEKYTGISIPRIIVNSFYNIYLYLRAEKKQDVITKEDLNQLKSNIVNDLSIIKKEYKPKKLHIKKNKDKKKGGFAFLLPYLPTVAGVTSSVLTGIAADKIKNAYYNYINPTQEENSEIVKNSLVDNSEKLMRPISKRKKLKKFKNK